MPAARAQNAKVLRRESLKATSGMLIGKTALITGSTQGLGLAVAEAFAGAGCHLVLNGFADPDDIAGIRRRLEEHSGVQTMHSNADLRRPDEIEKMIAAATETFGAVDILVNNAVVRHSAPVDTFAPAAWDEALAVNLSSAFHTTRLILPLMREKRWGRIVNVSSIYGLRGAANRVGYVATKTALIGLTRAVALETAGQNITCNAVCPGTTQTPVHETAIQELMKTRQLSFVEGERLLLEAKQPTRRLIAPANVAALILLLCSVEGADITGAVLPIDGGWSAS